MKFGTALGASPHFTTPPLTACVLVFPWLFDAAATVARPKVAIITTEIAPAPARQTHRFRP